MAARVESVQAMAPTHPNGPNSAVGNLLVGPFAAMADKVRDKLCLPTRLLPASPRGIPSQGGGGLGVMGNPRAILEGDQQPTRTHDAPTSSPYPHCRAARRHRRRRCELTYTARPTPPS
jgi:hypothetical protein